MITRPFRITEDAVLVNDERHLDLAVDPSLTEWQRREAERATNDRFERYLETAEANFGIITRSRYTALLGSFIEVVIKAAARTDKVIRQAETSTTAPS